MRTQLDIRLEVLARQIGGSLKERQREYDWQVRRFQTADWSRVIKRSRDLMSPPQRNKEVAS